MFARVSTIEGKPELVEEGARDFRNTTIPAVKKMPGFKDAYLLVDRKTGKVMAITLWETEKDLQSSAAAVMPLRSQGGQTVRASQPPKVEVFEVAVGGSVPFAAR